jgi:drug/metabolite transporter (DMT)-like permease
MVYLILSNFFYALSNLLWKRALYKFNLWFIIASRSLLTSIVSFIVIITFYLDAFNTLDFSLFLNIFIASVFGSLGLICMIHALKKGSLSQLALFNLIIVFLVGSFLFFFEFLHIENYWVASLLIISGFVLYIYQIKKKNNQQMSLHQLLLFSLMSIFFAGSILMHWYGLKKDIPVIFSLSIQEAVVFLSSITIVIISPSIFLVKLRYELKKISSTVILMATVIFAAIWTGFSGLKFTDPLISSLISLLTPILTILFGVIFYKDKWNYLTIFSFLLISSGIYLINLEIP